MPIKKKENLKASAGEKKIAKVLETLKADLTDGIKDFVDKNPDKSVDDVVSAIKAKSKEELQDEEKSEETEETSEETEDTEKSEENGEKEEGDAEGKILNELANTQDLLERATVELKEKDAMIDKFQEDYDTVAKNLESKEKELEEMKDSKFSKRIEELAAKEVALGTQTDKTKRIQELKSFTEKTLEQLEHVTDRLIERKKDETVSDTKRSEELLTGADTGDYKVVIEGDSVWAPDRGTKSVSEIKGVV